jgi:hypothetical protein
MGNGSPRLHRHLTRRVALVVLAALFGAPAAHADTLAPVAPASLPAVDPATTVATVTSAVEPVAATAGVDAANPVAPVLEPVRTVAPIAKIGPVAKTARAAVREHVRPAVAVVARSVQRPAIAVPDVAPKQILSSVTPTIATAAAPPHTDAQQRPVVRDAKAPQRVAKRAPSRPNLHKLHVQTAAAPAAAPGSAVPGALEREARVIPQDTAAAVGARPSPAPHAPHLTLAPSPTHSPSTAGWTDAAGGVASTGGILVAVVLGLTGLAWPRPGRRLAPRRRLAHPLVPLLALERPG